MKLKKLLQGTMFAAVAAVCMITGAVNADAAASASDEVTAAGLSSVSVDGASQTISASTGGKETLVGIGTVAKSGDIKVAAWDVYDGDATIDLSKLSNVKDNYIAIRSETSEIPTVIKIPKTATKALAAFNPISGELTVGEAKDKLAAVDGNYEYRTAYSSWKDAVETVGKDTEQVSLAKYQQQGVVLYVRKKGTSNDAIEGGTETVHYQVPGQTTKTDIKVCVGATLPGKEAKLSIAAWAKGPAVTADYLKGTVNIPKSSEYRVVNENGFTDSENWGNNNTTKPVAVPVDDLMSIAVANKNVVPDTAWVEVRTKEVTGAKSKAASKWTRLAIEKQPTLTIVEGEALEAGSKASAGDPYGDEGIKVAKLAEGDKDSILAVEYAQTKVNKVDTYTTVKITNNGQATYEISVSEKDEIAAKVTKITKGKSVVLKNVKDGSFVYVRKVGDKKAMQWTSAWGKLGVVDYPKVVEE